MFTEQALRDYAESHPDVKVALQEWTTIVKHNKWTCFADVKKFTIKFVYIRFIATHKEYDEIDCSTI